MEKLKAENEQPTNKTMITLPKKARPVYMRWGEIEKLARRNEISDWTLKKIFSPRDCAAKKWLQGRVHPLYVRRVVLELLGLEEESNP